MAHRERSGRPNDVILWCDLFALGKELSTAWHCFARFIGLSQSEYLILIAVNQAESGTQIGIAEVARRLRLSGAFVTFEVGELVRKGLLKKLPHSTDRRRVRLVTTRCGLEKLQSVAPIQASVNEALFASLDHKDFQRLIDIVEELRRDADRAARMAEYLTTWAAKSQDDLYSPN